MKMKAKGYSAGGAPKSRAQRRATLSSAQKNMLDGVQGREGSKQATSVIKDLSDEYGFKPGKRAGAKGGMGKGKRAKPPGMNMGGVAMAPPGTTAQRLPPSGGPKAIQSLALSLLLVARRRLTQESLALFLRAVRPDQPRQQPCARKSL
jgi:hypothetical protein